MPQTHVEGRATLKTGCVPVPRLGGRNFGVMHADGGDGVVGFVEKPAAPPAMPGFPDLCLASMGIYVFTARQMYEWLCEDAARQDSNHDFGRDILPPMINTADVYAYRFRDKNKKADSYWRDVGTLDAYYQTNMDL